MSYKGETIWIIGASSGIGKSLAVELANSGARLILSARREDKLIALNDELSGNHTCIALDVAKTSELLKTINYVFSSNDRIDRVVFMAGVYEPSSIEDIDLDFLSQSIHINLTAAMQLAIKALYFLNKQKSGQLVFCSSVASYVGLPYGQPYSATKAGLSSFVESLYNEVPDYIDVKLINPGFVRTELTDKNSFSMPALLEPYQAAKLISDGLQSNCFEISFPWRFILFIKLLRILPIRIKLYLAKKITNRN